ncbi:mono-functional DNA-alkylating methyl methanesulfonate N-term-domain-containing protein [Exophiala viscosa]|uniref:Mono-functional DNA-alkylating methyl methanesulfonate N-term-domain-containing protein n=1 Tax=Exophiala viscosa TaxID=2486360 RepID=A0AAN6DSI7_9EURO|nr:mono-functional DNA-alkylating methyl methanesulfonate N-term-domain-containing protein [Exophiala viscosa]
MSANRPKKSRSPNGEQGRLPAHERLGILSRTLNSSSSIRWILPAKIRSPVKEDVVFVGATFVQLHEFQETGQLVNTTAKLDFGTQITDAKVISADVEVVPIVDAILKQERDQERFTVHGEPVQHTQPPQILVIITVDNDLIYVYAREYDDGDVKLAFARRPLLRGAGLPSSECRSIAVESQSRALAIASPSGYFGIFKLRPIDEIKSEIDSWDPQKPGSFRPSEEQRFIQVDGDILAMSFLRSLESDPDKVILLLLVYSGEQTQGIHQYLYSWDTRSPLQTIKPMACSGRRLTESRLPSMLVPSAQPYSFMIVMDTGLSYYENVHTNDTKRIHCPFVEQTSGSLEWVQWAKPRRHNEYLRKRDDLVLVREDGMVHYFQIEKASSVKFSMNCTIGPLGFNVDTAFCMLAGPPDKGGDIIIAGGSMTDGGVFHVSARGSPECTQVIESVCPLRDMILGPSTTVHAGQSTTWSQETPDRLYACCSRGHGSGALFEIRYGLEAQIGWTMTYPDAALIDRIWTLDIPTRNELLLLGSQSTQSTMVSFDLDTQDLSFTDSETHPGFDYDHPTLAAAVIGVDIIVQVTTGSVNIIPTTPDPTPSQITRIEANLHQAAIFEGENILATVVRRSSGSEIALTAIMTTDSGIAQLAPATSTTLPDTANSLCCLKWGGFLLLVVGTDTGKLLGYMVSPDLTLRVVFQHRVSDLDSSIESSAVTSLVALQRGPDDPVLILCGLRYGMLLCLEMNKAERRESELSLRCDDIYRLGSTSVIVTKETSSSDHAQATSALVLCDSEMRRVTLHSNSLMVDYTVSSLWITNRSEPSVEPSINALHRIPNLSSKGDPGGLLVCATGDDLLFCSLVGQDQGIVRKSPIDGVPRRVLYSEYLQKFVVAFERNHLLTGITLDNTADSISKKRVAHVKNSGHSAPTPRKIQQVGLQLVDPSMTDTDGQGLSVVVTEETNETVNALIHWAPTDGEHHYEWFVLALEQKEPGFPQCSGRVVCVNAKSLSKGTPDSNPKIAFRSPDRPVTAICAYKMSSLLIAVGRELHLHHLDFATRKWKTLSKHPLPSYANTITCQGSMIFVATAQHSLFVLVERDNKLFEHKSDTEARSTRDVVVFDGTSAMFSAWNAGSTDLVAFSGFRKDGNEPYPLFHATLPLLVDNLLLSPSSGRRHRFYAGASDGTLFHLTVLRESEWELLHFLEQTSYMDKKGIKAVPIRKKDANNEDVVIRPPPVKLTDMHVRGDRLLMMIEDGPYNLRNVLRGSEMLNTFNALVTRVLGETEHPVDAVGVWLRKLLRYPSRS